MAATYTFFDHTGDFGADLEGSDLADVYAALAEAFLDLLTGDPDAVSADEARPLEARGQDEAEVLVALGNELIFRFEMGFLVRRLEAVSLTEEADGELVLLAEGWGEAFEPERHPIARPVKAVTHHAARVEVPPAGPCSARVIFDL